MPHGTRSSTARILVRALIASEANGVTRRASPVIRATRVGPASHGRSPPSLGGVSTHEVTNQAPPFVGGDFLTDDVALRESVERWAGPAAVADLAPLGILAGTEEAQEHGRLADTHVPVLRTHDARGNRVDEVEFHPSWHWLMTQAVGAGLTAEPWTSASRVRRARAPRRGLRPLVARRGGPRLPRLDDVCRGLGPATRRDRGCPLAARPGEPELRLRHPARGAEGRGHRGHGHDREAGRFGRARQHDPRRPRAGWSAARRDLPPDRSQVVLLGADERRLPRAGPGARRAHLLRRAACPRRRHAQPLRPPAPQGQARQPLERLERGRARRHLGQPDR